MRTLSLALLFTALAACDITVGSDKGGHSGTGPDGTGNPTTDTPTNPPHTLDGECDTPFETPNPGDAGLGACVTDEIACGQTLRGTIRGGSDVLENAPDHTFEQCSGQGPFGDPLDGPERVYKVDTTGYDTVSVRLVSCERLQLLWYWTADGCPQDTLGACSYVTVDGSTDQSEDILLPAYNVLWFAIEGLAGSDGNYELHVECGTR